MKKDKSVKFFLLVMIFLCVAVITGWRWMAQAATGTTADFDQITQAQITAAMGAGWNLGNTMEAFNDYGPNEEMWGNPKVTPELFTAVKNAGFKTVRI
ncbi:MAG TPA: glycosyl hydrolase, partial [Bacillota bacterium]|nr:glycosyl hydrolase [Bacillota bacterium]